MEKECVVSKLVFKNDDDMLKAFVLCKFDVIKCETEYDSELDEKDFDIMVDLDTVQNIT